MNYYIRMKVAIVHDWLVNYGGAERVVEQMMALYPDADIYTLVYDKKRWKGISHRKKSIHHLSSIYLWQQSFTPNS